MKNNSCGETHFGNMVALARMGFKVVPRMVEHHTKGTGTLYMDGDGLRFEPFEGEPFILTWEDFDNG